MSKHANPTLIGAFVVGAVILAVAAVLLLSSGDLFVQKPRFVLYFKGSVKGLNIGSPVTFRGVNIGTVTNIQLVMGVSESDIRIPVIIEINPANFLRSDRMIKQMSEKSRENTRRTDQGRPARPAAAAEPADRPVVHSAGFLSRHPRRAGRRRQIPGDPDDTHADREDHQKARGLSRSIKS